MRVNMLLIFLCCLSACVKENTSTLSSDDMIDSMAVKLYGGVFSDGPYGMVTGNASILNTNGKLTVSLENFNSTNGPDLKVYLSKEKEPINFYNLGSLKSTMGTQVYSIPPDVNISTYSYVLIHCQQYNHLFGYTLFK